MRKFCIIAAALLAGCVSGPVPVIHKTGSTYAERQLAVDECRIASLQAIPQAMVSQTSGGYYNPGTLQCSTIGNMTTCNRVGAVDIPSHTTTSDANQELRERYIDRCLVSKGFDVVPIPLCTSAKDSAQYRTMRDNQPPASQIKCVPNDPI